MRRRWPTYARVTISAAAVTALFWPIADYKWTIYQIKAFDPVSGAHPVYVSGPVGDMTARVTNHTWRLSFALPEAVLGALAAIGVFVLLGRWTGAREQRDTLCRRCSRILKGLREPTCPACGEHL